MPVPPSSSFPLLYPITASILPLVIFISLTPNISPHTSYSFSSVLFRDFAWKQDENDYLHLLSVFLRHYNWNFDFRLVVCETKIWQPIWRFRCFGYFIAVRMFGALWWTFLMSQKGEGIDRGNISMTANKGLNFQRSHVPQYVDVMLVV